MQYKFDGSDVIEGDSMFVVGQGPAKVIDMKPSYFRIKVGGRTRKVSYAGIVSGDTYRSVFWRDPIVVHPSKNAALWGAIRALAINVTAGFTDVVANVELVRVADEQEDLVGHVPTTQNAGTLQQMIEQAHRASSNVTNIGTNAASSVAGE